MEGQCEAYGWAHLAAVLQLVGTCVSVFAYPPLEAAFYMCTPHVANGTLMVTGAEHVTTTRLGIPCLLASFVVTVFVSMTGQAIQHGSITESTPYTTDGVREAGPWNPTFWGATCTSHAVVLAAVLSPGDVFAFALCLYMSMHALYNVCAPLPSTDSTYGHGRTVTLNFGVVGYILGMLIAFNQIPIQYPNRYPVLLVLGMLDYFLCVGHTWDQSPTMQTITNCRLCYCAAMSLGIISMYCAWHDSLLLVNH